MAHLAGRGCHGALDSQVGRQDACPGASSTGRAAPTEVRSAHPWPLNSWFAAVLSLVAVVLGDVCPPDGFRGYKAEHSSGDAFFP